jgi:hypothetical protein
MTTTTRVLHEVIDRMERAYNQAVPVDFTGRPDLSTCALLLAREAGIDFDDMRTPEVLTDEAWQRISAAVARMAEDDDGQV